MTGNLERLAHHPSYDPDAERALAATLERLPREIAEHIQIMSARADELANGSNVWIPAGSLTQVLPMDRKRVRCTLYNPPTGTLNPSGSIIAIGAKDDVGGGTGGYMLQPGAQLSVESTQDIYAYAQTGQVNLSRWVERDGGDG